ncbi:MAG: glycosyltransferase family 9 protein [Phycisphaerae bacterium]|nr:glycosyltransferase family 9 protein [Phycisphaerae bacterium]
MQNQEQIRNGVILHPGAVGDCLLTLPLADYMKKVFGLDQMDFIGRTEYIDFYPGRTCIDRIRSIESIELHRLFEDKNSFFLEDKDRLLEAFAGYEQIVSFLGAGHPSFETNLLFTVHSTHSADVAVLSSAIPDDYTAHITDFYLQQFLNEHHLEQADAKIESDALIVPVASDYSAGQEMLEQIGIQHEQPIAVIHPGSGSPAKSWHWTNYLQLGSELKANNIQTIFILGPAEQDRMPEESAQIREKEIVLENLTLGQVVQLLTQADVFVGNDSGISHLSGMLGKRTIALFGPTNPAHFHPLGRSVTILTPNADSFSAFNLAECKKVFDSVIQML